MLISLWSGKTALIIQPCKVILYSPWHRRCTRVVNRGQKDWSAVKHLMDTPHLGFLMKFHIRGVAGGLLRPIHMHCRNAWERVCTYREGKRVNSSDVATLAHFWKAGSLGFTRFPHQQIFINNCMEPVHRSASTEYGSGWMTLF